MGLVALVVTPLVGLIIGEKNDWKEIEILCAEIVSYRILQYIDFKDGNCDG